MNSKQNVNNLRNFFFQRSNEASEFHKQCLEAHNTYRAKHKVAPLNLNKELCVFAQEWADVS